MLTESPASPHCSIRMTVMDSITSRQNPLVREFRAAAEASADRLLLDGAHLLDEALAAAVPVDVVAVEHGARADVLAVAQRAAASGARVVTVTAAVLATMTPVRQPSGIVAIARRIEHSLDDALAAAPQMVLMLDEVQD